MFRFKKSKGFQFIKKTKTSKVKKKSVKSIVSNKLYSTFSDDADNLAKILVNFWKEQQNAITYKELREAIISGEITQRDIEFWREDYSRLVNQYIRPKYENIQGEKCNYLKQQCLAYEYNSHQYEFNKWMDNRCAYLVTACTEAQKNAIATIIKRGNENRMPVDEVARQLRPCIGLNARQALANARYYDNVKSNLIKDNPNMRMATAEKMAREAAIRYGERQHRYRAEMIAQTELSFANNHAYVASIKDAYQKGVVGYGKFVWSCTFDERSCIKCMDLDGTAVDIGQSFPISAAEKYGGQHEAPPAHPNCGCSLYFEQIEEPLYDEESYENNDINYLNSDENDVIINQEDKNMSLEYQRYGRNKDTLINNTYINSGDYRNKFDKITDNKNVNRILYAKAKEMLRHRSGTMLEDMYWININTGEIVASALNEQEESRIQYTNALKKAIKNLDTIIAMHTHPKSMPPSDADFNSTFKNNYAVSLVICHDGKVFQYESRQKIENGLYTAYINRFLIEGYGEYEAQLRALEKLKEIYDIDFWEVK